MVDCLLLILTGDVLTGITCTWTNIIGLYFFAIMLGAVEISLAVKYDNITGPATFGMFIGILMLGSLPPIAWTLPLFIFILNAGAVMYSVFFRD